MIEVGWMIVYRTKKKQVIIAGHFNISVDINNDNFSSAFISLLDSVGFNQCLHKPTFIFNIFVLILPCGVQIDDRTDFSTNISVGKTTSLG